MAKSSETVSSNYERRGLNRRPERANEEEREKAYFFHKICTEGFSLIFETNRGLDLKIHNTLSLTVAITPILLGVFYYLLTRPGIQLVLFPYILSTIGLGIVLFMVSICVGLRTYEPIEFDAVDPYVFLEKEQDKSLLDIQKDFVETTGSRISLNVRTVNSKGYLCMWMLRLLMCGGLFFGASFILLLFSLGYTYFLN